MRHDGTQLTRRLRTGVRALLGVADDESLQAFVEERGAQLKRRGERALRTVERVLQGLGIAPLPAASTDGEGAVRGDGVRRQVVPRPEQTKFDLGQGVDRTPPREHIPWGYGQDRVTAMVVDPERLYVYWEVTDDAIARARAGLGGRGADAWLNLRVYDVTGRIFDGTNAHAYFDHRVERHDRQWFFTVGKPGSSVVVEVGMKSLEGYFVRIARSGRADFPRTTPAPAGSVEWLTVRVTTGDVEPSWQTPRPARSAVEGAARDASRRAIATAPAAHEADAEHAEIASELQRGVAGWEWSEVLPESVRDVVGNGSWTSAVEHASWEAGPFAYPVEVQSRVVEEERPGHVRVHSTPRGTRVVYGPWQVTVRGLGARAERRVLARWELVRTWTSELPGTSSAGVWEPVAPGASELVFRAGASERRFGASEQRLAGASEVFFVGASELRWRGASERLYAGASERRWRGASEWRHAGGSERVHAGASERRLGGASERRLGGASEARSARESWQSFASEGARLVARSEGRDRPAPTGAGERSVDGGDASRRSELVADGDAPSEDPERPQPPRW